MIKTKQKEKDLIILSELRKNARKSLTKLSRKTRIPVSTLHDRIKMNMGSLIKKNCALIDFSKIGFSTRVNLLLKVKVEDRKEIIEYLKRDFHVNTLFRITNDYDLFVELIFTNLKESEEFIESLEGKFGIIDKKKYYTVEEISKEAFLSDPEMIKIIESETATDS